MSDKSDFSWSAAMANGQWADVDVVLALGTRLTQLREWGTDKDLAVIRVDIDYPEIVRSGPPRLPVVADAVDFTEALLAFLDARAFRAPDRQAEIRRRALDDKQVQEAVRLLQVGTTPRALMSEITGQ